MKNNEVRQAGIGSLILKKSTLVSNRDTPSVSVVMPAYNEEEGIGQVVDGFSNELKSMNISHEIIVVDNNCIDKTAEIAVKHGARVVLEKRQGYGFACKTALSEAQGDFIILTESDKTFDPKDIWKILMYLEEDDIDFVLGTRTTLELLERGAKMDWFLHWGNIFLAKLIQIQFWGHARLTDVGCTFRGIKRESAHKVLDKITDGGSCFSPEMIMWCLKMDMRPIEIPVKYLKREGQSKITVNKRKSFFLGLRMIKLIISQRFW